MNILRGVLYIKFDVYVPPQIENNNLAGDEQE